MRNAAMEFLKFVVCVFGAHAHLIRAQSVIGIAGPSGGDDRPLIQAKILEAVRKGNTAVYLGAGTYKFLSSTKMNLTDTKNPYFDQKTHLFIENGKGISLIGAAPRTVHFHFFDPTLPGITVHKTRNFNMQNITIDYIASPYGQGTVVAVDEGDQTVWVANDPGYPTWDKPQFYYSGIDAAGKAIPGKNVFLTATNRGGTPPICDFYKHPNNHGYGRSWGFKSGYNFFQYGTKACPAGLRVGQKVVLVAAFHNAPALHLSKVAGVVIQNSEIYRSPGTTVLVDHTELGDAPYYNQVLFDRLNITFSSHPAAWNRQISTNADGIHILGSRAPVNVYNSVFYGLADDGINAHVRTSQVWKFSPIDARGVQKMFYELGGGAAPLRAGDLIQMYNPSRSQEICWAYAIENSVDLGSSSYSIAIAPMYKVCRSIEAYWRSGTLTNTYTSDWVANVSEAGGSGRLTLYNNHFFANRGRAIINKWWNTWIGYNEIGSPFYGQSSWEGIHLGHCVNDMYAAEGPMNNYSPYSSNVGVAWNRGTRGNSITSCQ
jgi:hypothetical protein